MFAFSSPPEKLSVFETADNHSGLCCLGSKVVAFPGITPGQVQLVEINTGNVSIIPAHSTPLKALELSPDGQVLATASETVCLESRHKMSLPDSTTRALLFVSSRPVILHVLQSFVVVSIMP